MRTLSIGLLLIWLFPTRAQSQLDLSNSRQTSEYTYIYKISGDEALHIYQTQFRGPVEKYLHTLIDSCRTDHIDDLRSPTGNYIFCRAEGGSLETTLFTSTNCRYRLIDNNHDFGVYLYTREGYPVTDAQLALGHRRIPYDPLAHYYHIARRRKGGVLKIDYHGGAAFFSLTQRAAPYQSTKHYRSRQSFSSWTNYEQKFRSFITLNKPMFRPGDTVSGKAFIYKAHGKPYAQPQRVRISGDGLEVDTILLHVKPYRDGAYEFSFVLADSLGLDLDRDYIITLENDGSPAYDTKQYNGDLDNEEYAARRQVTCRTRFHYEDYELRSIELSLRSDQKENSPGNPMTLYCKATDENDLPVPDGRIELTVMAKTYGIKFHRPEDFIKDSLFSIEIPLDPVGETKIVLPDSIFPAADFDYEVKANLLNSENQWQEQRLNLHFQNAINRVRFTPVNDSLSIDCLVHNRPVSFEARLCLLDSHDDTISISPLVTPSHLLQNYLAAHYLIIDKNDSVLGQWSPVTREAGIQFQATRTKDSIRLEILNPQKLPFWYTIFASRHVITRGYGTSLTFAEKCRTTKYYFVSLQYLSAGQIQKKDYIIPYRNLLQVELHQPARIYPGQQSTMEIQVRDEKGAPVQHADVTAWGYTSRFRNVRANDVPFLGRRYPLLKKSRNPQPSVDKPSISRMFDLDMERWAPIFHLDTIAFYKFLHPAPVYINTEPDREMLTQLAPFVSLHGRLQQIHMLYIDDKPVFFSQASQLQRNSWIVRPGMHSLRIRLFDRLIRLDSVLASEGKKTFISIDGEGVHADGTHLRIQQMPLQMTAQEKAVWGQSMMLVANNFKNEFTSITQGDDIFLLHRPSLYSSSNMLVGPLHAGQASFVSREKFTLDFHPEGGYQFLFSEGLLKEKQLSSVPPFHTALNNFNPSASLRDRALTVREMDSLWQEDLDEFERKNTYHNNEKYDHYSHCRMRIGLKADGVKLLLLFRYDDPAYLHIENGGEREISGLAPGLYRLMILLKGNSYLLRDSILLYPGGLHWYSAAHWPVHAADSTSKRIDETLKSSILSNSGSNASDLIRVNETFNAAYLAPGSLPGFASGRVTDQQGEPLVGVSVSIKGTNLTAVTNRDGYFSLSTPVKGYLDVSFVGFERRELPLGKVNEFMIRLKPMSSALNEVVVIGYGTTSKRLLTGSVATIQSNNVNVQLAGKVAGIVVQPSDEALALRMPIQRSQDLLTEDQPPSQQIRRSYRDDAFWQPRLTTDGQGIVRFHVRFPDDITSWKTFAAAFTDRRQAGVAEGLIKAFKPISAQLAMPRFTIEGDSMTIIGKLLNYTNDTANVKRTFRVDSGLDDSLQVKVASVHLDHFAVKVLGGDSIGFHYDLLRQDGYMDGEERKIPVFPAGIRETKGIFLALRHDTTLTVTLDSAGGPIHVFAASSLSGVISSEIDQVVDYEYNCNEQLASKLKALLVKKQLAKAMKNPFHEDGRIRELIIQLQLNRHAGGAWGWWRQNEPALWVTLHVVEALMNAGQQGFGTNVDRERLIDWIVYRIESCQGDEKLDAMRVLQMLGSNYKTIPPKVHSFHQALRLLEWRQRNGDSIPIDSVLSLHRETAFGNYYWGDDSLRLLDNVITNTVLVYRMLRNAGGQQSILEKIRGYFLESRQGGHWRNTYESSELISALYPDCINELVSGSTLRLDSSQPIEHFPYTTILTGHQVHLDKKGNSPVYFTAYQTYWNSTPKKLSRNFRVESHFECNGEVVSRIKTGQAVYLVAEVQCLSDADYAMVEIPLPAGCTAMDKTQSFDNYETHREYFKQKVNIFCSRLPAGKYRFVVELMPRFSGRFQLNPALAQCMYFPVFSGREALRTVDIN